MKQKKFKLFSEFTYDFHVYGIISKVKEFTLSWGINSVSNIELSKEDDLIIDMKGGNEKAVSNYKYTTDILDVHLFKNQLDNSKNLDNKYFIPTLQNFDYLLKIDFEDDSYLIDELFMHIRKSNKIESILKLDINKIKEKEFFLF